MNIMRHPIANKGSQALQFWQDKPGWGLQFSIGDILGTECQLKELALCKYISTSFLVVGLLLFAISASEAKTPVYCETTQILQIERHKIITSKNEKFRMTVSSGFVDFGINGFTGGTNSFKISRFEKLTDWQADYDRFYISFLGENFYFAAVFPHSSRAVSAKCQIY